MKNKIGIVDVGGGCRGVYAAGVFDYFADHNITFDLGIGVSAGSANLASFIARQPRRNYKFYTEYALRSEYMSVKNFITKKSFIGLDYVYGTLTNDDGEYPIDYETFINNPMEFYVIATNAETGNAHYIQKRKIKRNHDDTCGVSTLSRNQDDLIALYYKGYKDGEKIISFI